MLNEFLLTKIEEENVGNIWFQQEATLNVLRHDFEDRIISRRADVVWPPQSCDLTPLDYYLWGAVKDKCYALSIVFMYSVSSLLSLLICKHRKMKNKLTENTCLVFFHKLF